MEVDPDPNMDVEMKRECHGYDSDDSCISDPDTIYVFPVKFIPFGWSDLEAFKKEEIFPMFYHSMGRIMPSYYELEATKKKVKEIQDEKKDLVCKLENALRNDSIIHHTRPITKYL